MPIRPRVEQWDEAGISTADGHVGRTLRSTAIRVPAGVRVDSERLAWDGLASPVRWAAADPVMLNSFVRISRPRDRAGSIERFAKRYGVLGAAELKQDAPRIPNEIHFDEHRWMVGHGDPYLTWEPLRLWSETVDSVVALLNIGAATKLGRCGAAQDWTVLGYSDFDPKTEGIADARWLLREILNDWLKVGEISFRLMPAGDWTGKDWDTEISFGTIGNHNLFGAIALQMTLAVAGIDLYCCTGCKLPYVRSRLERRPKPTENNYCSDCRQSGEPLRAAKLKYRRSKENAKKTRPK